jgi:hypothetical protein
MRSRLIAVFVVGVLVGAALLGGRVFALQAFGNEAQAQSGATWQVEYLGEGGEKVYIETIEKFVTSLPAECDLVTSTQKDLFYYRCPAS